MCVLRVVSKTTSFQEFLKNTELPVYRSHEKGEKVYKTRPPLEYYGFSCNASKKKWDDLDGQIHDIISFLEKYENELKSLTDTHIIDDIRFDFPYYCRINSDRFIQCEYLPSALLLKSGKLGIGIELSLYRTPKETIMDKIMNVIEKLKFHNRRQTQKNTLTRP